MRSYDLIEAGPSPQDLHKQQVRYLRWAIVQTVAALGLIILASLLFLVYNQVQGDVAWLEAQAAEIEVRLGNLNTPSQEVQRLQEEIGRVEALAGALEAAQIPTDPPWPAVVTTIGSYDPQQITLTSLTQTGNQLALAGRATDNAVVGDFVQSLEESSVFASIDIQSMRQAPTNPATAAPTDPPEQEQAETTPKPVEFILTIVLAAPNGNTAQSGASQ